MNIPQLTTAIFNGIFGRYQRSVVSSLDGGNPGPPRMDHTNELIVESLFNSHHMLAVEGSLYVAQTATPGTGITFTSATGTTFADTQAIFGVNNLSGTLQQAAQDVIPLWLKIIITGAGTAGIDSHVASRLSKGARVTAGTQLLGKNVNPNVPVGEGVTYCSVLPTVAAADGTVQNVGRAEVRKAAAPGYIVGDQLLFLFGAVEQVYAQAQTPTTTIDRVVGLPAIVIPPGWNWVLNEWMTARTAAQTGEFEFGYLVRGQ